VFLCVLAIQALRSYYSCDPRCPATAQAGHTLWHHPSDAGFADIPNEELQRHGGFHPYFKGRPGNMGEGGSSGDPSDWDSAGEEGVFPLDRGDLDLEQIENN
jgi:hypothetical protein